MFSFTQGRPIAKIVGGEYNDELIHIKTESEEKEHNCYCCGKCSKKCFKKPCCKKCCLANDSCSSEEEEDLGTEFEIDDGKLEPVPNIDTREIFYVAGPSGSGKSTLISKYAENYKKLFPDKDIIIFSRKPTDPVLDRLRPSRFIIDETIVTNPIDITKDLTGGALVVFDDCNTFQDKKIKDAVSKLMNDILEIGRSYNVYCAISSHLINPNERKDARTIMNESHSITIFPKSGNQYAMNYALKNYCGFDKKAIAKILKVPSRWVTIHKSYPQIILHERGCYIP
jgi:hypothetical protein